MPPITGRISKDPYFRELQAKVAKATTWRAKLLAAGADRLYVGLQDTRQVQIRRVATRLVIEDLLAQPAPETVNVLVSALSGKPNNAESQAIDNVATVDSEAAEAVRGWIGGAKSSRGDDVWRRNVDKLTKPFADIGKGTLMLGALLLGAVILNRR